MQQKQAALILFQEFMLLMLVHVWGLYVRYRTDFNKSK